MLNVGNPARPSGWPRYPTTAWASPASSSSSRASCASTARPAPSRPRARRQGPREIDALTQAYADRGEYFVERLAEGVAIIAAAFYPKDVIVRLSDFKSNEYAGLIGGRDFEPEEGNPMLGFRGAFRYAHPRYREAFALECRALRRVREQMGLTNVKLMIPFCRTPREGQRVLDLLTANGLTRGENGLEVYVMAEIPSNAILADEFAALFDAPRSAQRSHPARARGGTDSAGRLEFTSNPAVLRRSA
jgi:pyruvate,water dikinase